MEAQQSSNIHNDDNIDHFDNIDSAPEPPFVAALTTQFAQPIKQHAVTLRKLQEEEREIQRQQRQIQDLKLEAQIKVAHHENLLQGAQISRLHPLFLRAHRSLHLRVNSTHKKWTLSSKKGK
jgi:hypothetical protein